ncbi:PepSY-associated TM helix domain-containing protein [Rufibacter roseus]|uniref:PepSY-associated TM helix domain-containing protein n=1 Tax=Rufibacter roseus TaxID=1567108 RepID=A0ABW2DNN9_9BACT|nr:PepSY-associated TM helix domain-containing protein [Rufibacter roseus]
MKKRTKRTFSIHHWLGLWAGTFLLISSLTGTVLVFHHEIDHAQHVALSTLPAPAEKLRIDASFQHIRKSFPEGDLRIPELPQSNIQALKYEIRQDGKRQWIFAHPQTGQTLGTLQRADKRLVHVLLDTHYNLLMGKTGKVLVLLGGLSLVALTVTGFLLYRKSIMKVLSFRQTISFKSRRSFFSSLHRIVGVWSLVFNLLLSVTGSYIAYTIVLAALSPAPASSSITASPVSIDTTLEKIRKEHPHFQINYLRMAGNSLSVLGKLQDDPAYYGRTYSNIQVDLNTGAVTSVNFLRDKTWYQRALSVLKPLHFGDYAGLGVKLLYSFFGFMPSILAISGFVIWRFRRSASKKGRPMKHSQKVNRLVTPA